MHPSQSIPATANVTVAERWEVRQAFVQRAIVKKNTRLVIGVCSQSPNHITKHAFVSAKSADTRSARRRDAKAAVALHNTVLNAVPTENSI